MRIKITVILCLLLAACFVLGACTPTPDPDTEETSEQVTETNSETEAMTEPPIEIQVPEGEIPDLTGLLAGDNEIIDLDADMKNKTPGQLISEQGMMFVTNLAFTKSADGLKSQSTGWDSVGFSEAVSTDSFVVGAKFRLDSSDRSGSFNAPMVGIYCKGAKNLFIDGGVWFSFRDSTAAVYVKNGIETNIVTNLPFDAKDGIEFRAEGTQSGASIYANDVLVATVELGEQVIIKDASGKQVAACGTDHVSPTGYFRYMSHFSNATLESMSLYGETKRTYAPEERVYAFQNDVAYAFADKAQYLTALPTTLYSDVVYADALVLGKMLGFNCTTDAERLTMTRDGVTLTFEAGQTGIDVNGRAWAFPTTVYTKDTFMLPVAVFGEMLGYVAKSENGLTVLALQEKTEEAMTVAQERYDLYQSVVYNYDDVECDQTGVGKFEQTPYADRLVGIAYSPWHTASRSWGSGTWDLPLWGPYLSDNEDILRLHAELLRDAGIDFVFIDWSNNTDYDPATMRDYREDFRMIEEATDKMYDVWATVEGAPKICIFVGPGHNGPGTIDNGNHQKKVDQVWRDYVTNPSRADMYFEYEGKPLLICYGATPTLYTENPTKMWDDDRFTVRWITGYVGQQGTLFREKTLQSKGYWSWEERGAQTYTVLDGKVEAVTVSASTRAQGKEGDSGYIPAAGRENGATLKKQFQRACDLGAGIVLIVSWNEWTTGEQLSPEISKDMEPSQIHGTFYYDLMREQIKKFKGKIPTQE